jgi:hypothetical protein
MIFFFLQAGCTLPTIVIPYWFFCLTADERRDYFERLRTPWIPLVTPFAEITGTEPRPTGVKRSKHAGN